MKKYIVFSALILSLSTFFAPTQVKAEANSATATANEQAEARAMMNRLHEIQALTKTNLSTEQKRELRKELRAMKEKAKSRPGIYISLGALILIIILLIILL